MNKIVPIVKWAGGKRQLLSDLLPMIPTDFSTYYEPFIGGGAVLFELQPKKAVINDTNSELINLYRVTKEEPNELIREIKLHENAHSQDYYYSVRDLDRNQAVFARLSPIERAARTVYLNRACYNGLYRVNKDGCFNTPMGRNSSICFVNETDIFAISEYLNQNSIRILEGDYKGALKYARKSSFVFLDPPYYPVGDEYFLRYDRTMFGVKQQYELKAICDSLTQRGIRFIETNSDCDEVRKLYNNYQQTVVEARRSINANPNERRTTELIISNY